MNHRKSRGRIVMISAAFVALTTAWLPMPPVEAAPTSCEDLASLVLPEAAITAAQLVPAGAFTPPAAGRRGGGNRGPAPEARGAAEGRGAPQARGGGRGAAVYQKLPAFCRVAATLTPSRDSDIKVEVWLPSAGWNGVF